MKQQITEPTDQQRWHSTEAFVAACTAASKITEATGGMSCTIDEINAFQELLKQQGFSILPIQKTSGDKWIRCEDKMPPLETVVLLWVPCKPFGFRTLGEYYWDAGVAWASGSKKLHTHPTHWQPLPDSPEQL